jgi:hypothetical protein
MNICEHPKPWRKRAGNSSSHRQHLKINIFWRDLTREVGNKDQGLSSGSNAHARILAICSEVSMKLINQIVEERSELTDSEV